MILAAALAAALAAPASAFLGLGGATMSAEREAYKAGRYAEVVSALTPERLQRLRRADQRDAYLFLAESHEHLGDPDKALGVYQVAAKLYPRDLTILTQLGNLLHRAGLEEQARPLFERVLEIHPNNAAAHLGLAEIDGHLGFLSRSADHYETALEAEEAPRASTWRDYAEVLLARRDVKTAELAAQRSLKLSREPETLAVLAQTRRADGRLADALATLDEALAFKDWARAPEAALMKAVWLLEAARYDEALSLAEAALKNDEDDPLARWVRARVELKRDRFNAAVKDLEAAADAGKRAPFVARAASALLQGLKGTK